MWNGGEGAYAYRRVNRSGHPVTLAQLTRESLSAQPRLGTVWAVWAGIFKPFPHFPCFPPTGTD